MLFAGVLNDSLYMMAYGKLAIVRAFSDSGDDNLADFPWWGYFYPAAMWFHQWFHQIPPEIESITLVQSLEVKPLEEEKISSTLPMN